MENGPARGWRRSWRLIGFTALVLTLPALAAVATHRFTDVPDSHVFHDDIAWLADRGITSGCNPPDNTMFCPEDPVTRGEMAAFMRRFAAGTGAEGTTPAVHGAEGPARFVDDNSWVSLTTVDLTVPPGGGTLLVTAAASMFIEAPTDGGAVGLLVATPDDACSDSMTGPSASWATATAAGVDSAALTGLVPVTAEETTIRLCALALHLDPAERTELVAPSITAMAFPDGTISTQGEPPTVAKQADLLRERITDR